MKYQTWRIPATVLAETQRAFLSGQHEVFAIWTASIQSDSEAMLDANVLRCIVPAQEPGVSAQGVWVHIDGAELQRVQIDNYRRQERAIVQLHTHPGADVQMSGLDREWEVVRHIGALSIIVPHYGKHGLSSLDGVNVYEREENDWRLWTSDEVTQRLVRT